MFIKCSLVAVELTPIFQMKVLATLAATVLANTTRRTADTNKMLNLYNEGLEVSDLTAYGCNCFEVSQCEILQLS